MCEAGSIERWVVVVCSRAASSSSDEPVSISPFTTEDNRLCFFLF